MEKGQFEEMDVPQERFEEHCSKCDTKHPAYHREILFHHIQWDVEEKEAVEYLR